jgi:ribosome-binding ATPase YchF (GTP1/OBG family)
LAKGVKSSGLPRVTANAESSLRLRGYICRGCASVNAWTVASIRFRAKSAGVCAHEQKRRHVAASDMTLCKDMEKRSNENKMSDGHRRRAALAGKECKRERVWTHGGCSFAPSHG